MHFVQYLHINFMIKLGHLKEVARSSDVAFHFHQTRHFFQML